MKIRLKITSFVLAMLLLLSAFVGCTGYVDPLGYLKDAAVKTLKSSFLGEVLALLFDVSNKGTIAVDFGGTDLVQNLPEALKLQLWVDAEDRKVAADGAVTLQGREYDVAAYLNENEMAVVSSAFLGSTTLGVDFLTLKKDLQTSIFSNNSGTVFSNPTISAASADRVEELKQGFFKLLASGEKSLDFVDEVLEVFLDELTSYAENSRYKEDGYTHITLSINNDSLARTLRATRAALVKDRSFCNYLNDLAATLDSMTSATTGVTSTEYTTKVKYFLSNEADINALCQRIDDADPFTLKLGAAVKSFGMSLEDVSVSFAQNDVMRLAAVLHLEENALSLDVTWDGIARKLTYAVVENGFRTYRAAITYQLSGAATTELKGELLANKRDGSYTLTLEKGAEKRTLGGKYDFDSDKMMLSVERASIHGEEKKISLKISAVAGEGVPMTPEYVNLVKMDVTRYTPIFERSMKARLLWADWKLHGPKLHDVLGDVLGAIGLPEELPIRSE